MLAQEPSANRPETSLLKKKTFHFSVNSFLLSQSDYLDGCQIYLLGLQDTDILDHIEPFIVSEIKS